MENLNIKINLGKLNGVCTTTNKKNGKKYICLPIEDNYVFEGTKGYYLNLTAFVLENGKFGDSHYIKNQVPQEIYNKMTKEEKENLEIIGSCSVFNLENKNVKKVDNQDFNAFEDGNEF